MQQLGPDNPLAAAFDVGMCLNELRWRLVQAVVCFSRNEAAAATVVLDQIKVLAIRLFPEEHGGDVRETTVRWRQEWPQWLDFEYINEFACGVYASLEAGHISIETATRELVQQAPDIEREIEAAILAQLRSFPAMLLALQLGRCIDEGRHVPWPGYELIALEENPLWQRPEMPFQSQSSPLASHVHRPRLRSSSEIQPASHWPQEVQSLWQRAISTEPCPEILGADLGTPTRRGQLVQRLIDVAYAALSGATCPGWEPASEPSTWPPDTGWHFRDGQFALNGRPYSLSRQPLLLLRRVKEAQRPLTSAELTDEIWRDDPPPTGDPWKRLRNLENRLNRQLRVLFADTSPIPQIRGSGEGGQRTLSVIMSEEPTAVE